MFDEIAWQGDCEAQILWGNEKMSLDAENIS